jgi:uncharacterized RDD family membrane protein YckC
MQTISVRTTQNVFIHYPLASVGDRILAHLIDRLMLGVYSAALIILFIQIEMEIWWVWLICVVFPWLFYSLLFEIFMNGQTLGKRLMKIQVVRMNGTPATIGDYLLRWLLALVDIYMLSGAIGIIVIAFGGKGQRIGDIVAGTTVVKLIQQKEITAADVFVTTEDTYKPTFAQVTQLSEKDIELIQRALTANRNQGNLQPVMLVTEKIKNLLGIQTDLPPVQFLSTIVKDFNHLNAR